MKSFFIHILFLCLISVRLLAQEKFDANTFANLNDKDRYAYALKVASGMDSITLIKYLHQALPIAYQKKDRDTEVLLLIQYFNYLYYVTNNQSANLVKEAILKAIKQAEEYEVPIQLNIARIHYGGLLFNREKNYDKAYEIFLRAYQGLEEIGFAKMQHYPGAPLSEVLYYPALN